MPSSDPFVVLAAGRSPFRIEDVAALADLADGIAAGPEDDGVREIPPAM
jgi:hypothetical protein